MPSHDEIEKMPDAISRCLKYSVNEIKRDLAVEILVLKNDLVGSKSQKKQSKLMALEQRYSELIVNDKLIVNGVDIQQTYDDIRRVLTDAFHPDHKKSYALALEPKQWDTILNLLKATDTLIRHKVVENKPDAEMVADVAEIIANMDKLFEFNSDTDKKDDLNSNIIAFGLLLLARTVLVILMIPVDAINSLSPFVKETAWFSKIDPDKEQYIPMIRAAYEELKDYVITLSTSKEDKAEQEKQFIGSIKTQFLDLKNKLVGIKESDKSAKKETNEFDADATPRVPKR